MIITTLETQQTDSHLQKPVAEDLDLSWPALFTEDSGQDIRHNWAIDLGSRGE